MKGAKSFIFEFIFIVIISVLVLGFLGGIGTKESQDIKANVSNF